MFNNTKFAVVVLDIPFNNNYFNEYEKINWSAGKELCLQSIEKYCKKYQLDFVKIDRIKILHELDKNFVSNNSVLQVRQIVIEKFQLRDILKKYDRILYLDTDCFVHKNTENIFDTNNNLFYIGNSDDYFKEKSKHTWEILCEKNNIEIPFAMNNGGFFTMSKKHIEIFNYLDMFGKDLLQAKFIDQTFITSVSSYIYNQTLDIDFKPTSIPIKYRGKKNDIVTKFGVRHFAGLKGKQYLMDNISHYEAII